MSRLAQFVQALAALQAVESGTGLATDDQIDAVATQFDLDRWMLQDKYAERAERIAAENTED